MARTAETSRTGRHYRAKDPDHPVAQFCSEAVRRHGGNAAKLADELGVTRAAVSQWLNGQAYPKADVLIAMSQRTGLSLGYLSVLAAGHAGKDVPRIGELEGRCALLPAVLRKSVADALDMAEALAKQLPAVTRTADPPDPKPTPAWKPPIPYGRRTGRPPR